MKIISSIFKRKRFIEDDIIFNLLFESLPTEMIFIQTDGTMRGNKSFCSMLGYDEDELTALDWNHFTHLDDTEKCHEIFNHLLNGESNTVSIDKRYINKEGKFIAVKETLSVHKDDKNKPLFIIGLVSKVNEQKSEASTKEFTENDFKNLYKNLPLAILVYDMASLKFIEVNDAALNLYGYTSAEFLNLTIEDIRITERQPLPHIKDNFSGKMGYSLVHKHKKKDGRIFNADITSQVMNLNDKKVRIVTVRELYPDNSNSSLIINAENSSNFHIDYIEEKFRSFFEYDLSGNYISTVDGKIVAANERFRDILGFKGVEETLITPIEEIYKNVEDRKKLLDKIILERKVENYEMELVARNGKMIHILANILGEFDDNGNLQYLLGQIFDISDRNLAVETIKQLSAAVEQSPVSIVITDPAGYIQYANPKCLELTGYELYELIGKNPSVFKSGEKPKEEYAELWKTIRAGKEWRGEFHNRKKNGELYWEFASISPIKNKDGVTTSFLAVKEDITQRKKSEQELIEAKEKAELINRIKTTFFSNMSHELRTPLSGILGFTELLLEEIKDPEQRKMLDSITLSGQRLLETLNRILQISKIESDRLIPMYEEVEMSSFIQSHMDEFKTTTLIKDVQIEFKSHSENLYAKIDKGLFRSVLSNLLSNALKFTKKGYITVICKHHTELGKPFVRIDIKDTGIGISKANLEIIFEEFRQASEGLNRMYEGTGLGLAIVKKFTESMGGKVYVESELEKGSTFSVCFPLSVQSISAASIKQVRLSDETFHTTEKIKKKPLILLVEDDLTNCEIVKVYLTDFCKLHIANNGKDAMELIMQHKYDAFLMDIALGSGVSGVEVSKVIKSTPGYENTPIIALTAYAMNGEKEKLLNEGLTHYISKPYKMGELIDTLTQALSHQKLSN